MKKKRLVNVIIIAVLVAFLAVCKIKIKAYDPNFITSFNATFTSNKTPSEMFDAERADRINTIKSLILAFVSAVFIGRLFAKVIFNFSSAVIFAAIPTHMDASRNKAWQESAVEIPHILSIQGYVIKRELLLSSGFFCFFARLS